MIKIIKLSNRSILIRIKISNNPRKRFQMGQICKYNIKIKFYIKMKISNARFMYSS